MASPSRDLHATINYVKPDYGGAYWPPPGSSLEEHQVERAKVLVPQNCQILDGNQVPGGLGFWDFDKHGFTFLENALPPPLGEDFKRKQLVYKEYLPQIAEMAKQKTGASHAIGFQTLTRYEFDSSSTYTNSIYARFAHADYGARGGPETGRLMLVEKLGFSPEEAEKYEVCFANVWHPIDYPAYKDPFALLDWSTVPEPDIYGTKMPTDINNLVGGVIDSQRLPLQRLYQRGYFTKMNSGLPQDSLVTAAKFAPNHRWVYCPDMPPQTAWLFKQWDSRADVAQCSYHTAINDPFHEKDPSKPERRSIELRILLAWPKKEAGSKL